MTTDLALLPGKALVVFDDQANPEPWARLLRVRGRWAFIMKFPRRGQDGVADWYVPGPKRLTVKKVQEEMRERGLRLMDYRGPSRWYWTDQDLANMKARVECDGEDEVDKGLGTRGDRRNIDLWIAERDRAWSFVEPLFKEFSIADVLELGLYRTWPSKRAKELGVDSRHVVRACRLYMLSLGQLGALMPAFDQRGAPGVEKFSKVPTGRKTDSVRSDGSRGFAATAGDRKEMQDVWKKHKKKGMSVEKARERGLTEYRAESLSQEGPNVDVTLKPEGQLWSIGQLRRHGPRGQGNLSASAVNRGDTESRPAHKRRAKARSMRPDRIGLVAQIDSSPADFYPCSAASSLHALCKPWRTELTDEELGYTFGLYVGFEHVSTCTSLLAILNAAEDHVGFCALYGIHIEPWQWHSRPFRRVKADNGEMKAQSAFKALGEMEQTGEYCRAYAWEDKALQESRHRTRQAAVEHQVAGTDQGKRTDRGASDPKQDAAVTLYAFMQQLIKHILWKNNEELVPHLLTVEMRNGGVLPFRGEIYRWCLKKGYVAEEAMDLTALRARCLPAIEASLHSNGVHLFDPTSSHKRLIQGVVFSSNWLKSSGHLARAGGRTKRVDARINPSRPKSVFVEFGDDGMKELNLQTDDPLRRELTLAEWLHIDAGDRVFRTEHGAVELDNGASRLASLDATNRAGRAKKRKEIANQPVKPSKASLVKDMDERTRRERRATSEHYIPGPHDQPQQSKAADRAAPVGNSVAAAMAKLRQEAD
ncbi:hypothetical protein [Aquincola tertiaricarbonis]|uniref:hypothetical protein n=1 Tax=Aquincola tertiaricarbonis TaxID=391953 RepID=UPI0006153093|nr:hypothetical protein [Aquincola tertiaricarbonis]